MTRTKCLLSLLTATLLAGCFPYSQYTFRSYTLGRVDSCRVGEPVLQVFNGWIVNHDSSIFRGSSSELIYTGTSTNTLHLTHREYQTWVDGSYIRPAFTIDLQYDLKQSRTIAFREYLIDAIEASPVQLKFKIVQDQHAGGLAYTSGSPNRPEPVPLLPLEKRRHVRILLINNATMEVYVVAETTDKYYVSNVLNPDSAPGAVRKETIREIVDIK